MKQNPPPLGVGSTSKEKVRQERTAEQARIEAAKKEKQAGKEKAAAEERKHAMKAVHNQ